MNGIFLIKMSIVGLLAFFMTAFSITVHAGENNFDEEKDTSVGTQPAKPFNLNKLSHHQLSAGLMIPVAGWASSLQEECGYETDEACPVGDIAPFPGISLQYDFRPFKYFSLGASVEYQSFFAKHSQAHKAEMSRLAIFIRGILPLANNRLELYLQGGYFLGFNWIWDDQKYYGFEVVPINFMASVGVRFWITKRMGVYLDCENDFGGLGAATLLYFAVKSGIVVNF